MSRSNSPHSGAHKQQDMYDLKLLYGTFRATQQNSYRYASYGSVILIESKSKTPQICSMCAISMLPTFKYLFASFTFGFVHQLQTAGNTTFLVMENIFHSGLDDTMILYTTLACFATQTEIRQTITILATRKWQSDFCIVHL